MSCTSCERAHADSTVRSRSIKTSDSSRDPREFGPQELEQDMARIRNLQGECLVQQAQTSQDMQRQLQSILEEQASLRDLLQSQHEQVLQRLPSKSGQGGEAWQRKVPLPTTLPPPLPELENGQVMSPASPSSPSKAKFNRQQSAQVKNRHSKHVLLDISKLPQTWSCTESKLFDQNGKKGPNWYLRLAHFVRGGLFDAVFITVIFANFITMLVQLEWRGYYASYTMGQRDNDAGWPEANAFFESLDLVYTTIFLVELILRLSFLHREFLRAPANIFDTVIVVVSCTQAYILQPIGRMADASSISLARLLRLLRVLRFMKIVRYTEAATELRILARALSGCLGSLFWSMLLLVSLIVSGSVMLFQMTVTYVEDENNPYEVRHFAYVHFGTVSLSMMALWESTFTGSWHRYSRDMITKMGAYYALFWVPYIVCVNFAVMRLISALFLKNTMAVASVDAEKMSIAKMKRKTEFADRVREIFAAADTSGDGKISADEFEDMLSNPTVGDCFEQLELEVAEVATLFELLAADDGEADYHEFLEGALKLKQSAQTADVIQIIHNNRKLAVAMHTLNSMLCDLARFLGAPLDHMAEELAEQLDQGDAMSFVHHKSTKSVASHHNEQHAVHD